MERRPCVTSSCRDRIPVPRRSSRANGLRVLSPQRVASLLAKGGCVITVAFDAAFFDPSGRVAPHFLPSRPREVVDGQHAGRVLQLAPAHRDVLPRWGINSPIRDHGADPGQYSGTIGWPSREHYLAFVVPAAIAAHADVLAKHHVSPALFRSWVAAKSLYAQERRSGRRVVVRPITLAGLLQCAERTVQRCQAAAREIGLEVVITPGRMLSEFEVYAARKQGSPQRGLSTVSAFVVPTAVRRIVEHVTPTRGGSLGVSVTDIHTFKQRSARSKGAPLRSAPHQQETSRRPPGRNGPPAAQKPPPQRRTGRWAHQGPAWKLAAALTTEVIFLHRCPPGRIARQLQRYTDPQRTGGRRWTTVQLLDAMTAVNRRLGYRAPVKVKTAPWALLAWYLAQIDPFADHPANTEPSCSTPWCGKCASDTFRWIEAPVSHDPVRPCPRCSPQACT